jgi:hypothetical protein
LDKRSGNGSGNIFARFARAVSDGSVEAIMGGLVVVVVLISIFLLAFIWIGEINNDKEKLRNQKPGFRLVEARYLYSLDCSMINKKELELSPTGIKITKTQLLGADKTVEIPYLGVNNIVFRYGGFKKGSTIRDINKIIIGDEKEGTVTFCLKDVNNFISLKEYIYGVYNSGAKDSGGEGGAERKEQGKRITIVSEGGPSLGKGKASDQKSDIKGEKTDASDAAKPKDGGSSTMVFLVAFLVVCLVSLYFSMASSDVWQEQVVIWKERWQIARSGLRKLKRFKKPKKEKPEEEKPEE